MCQIKSTTADLCPWKASFLNCIDQPYLLATYVNFFN